VIERLGDPLVHIIRNCIDHGIERPDARMKAGKPRRGEIHLSALHSGAHVLIRIRDDGAGLDTEAIRAKAVEKGLLKPDTLASEQALWEMIVTPGFSTAANVTGVSGRGVGMDVVKKAIDALHGTLEISSVRGAGTTITLKLPLTLAIIDGFLTRIEEENYIFPLSLVEECVELTHSVALNRGNRHLINVRGSIVPYVRLREQFAMTGKAPMIEQIVIVRIENKRIGFAVDHVVGGHQTVIKSLGAFYRDVEGISGATILGDGTVALILDVTKLVHIAEQEEVDLASPSG
jgi:two-component system chemotaxis sensor kinase CheA